MNKREFRILLEPEKFLNRVCTPSSLEEIVENVNYIVSPKDLTKVVPDERITISLMRYEWIEALIKSIRYYDGENAYNKCEIRIGRIDPNLLWYVQTFVQNDKIISLGNFISLLKKFSISGFSKIGGLIIKGKGKDNNVYLAFYVPPIVEVWKSEDVKEMVLERMDNLEEIITLPGFSGDVNIYPKKIMENVIKILEKVNSIYWLRDGTHRTYITSLAGTTMQVILLNGRISRSAALPIPNIDYLVVTREKPKEKRHRFLGFDPEGWMDYHGVGIDG